MNHAITIGGLLLSLGIIVGLIAAVIGAVVFFAGGMSDAPSAGGKAARAGCALFIGGTAVVIGCVARMVL